MEASSPLNRVTGVFLSCPIYSFNVADEIRPPLVATVSSARLFCIVTCESVPWSASKKRAVESVVWASLLLARAASALASGQPRAVVLGLWSHNSVVAQPIAPCSDDLESWIRLTESLLGRGLWWCFYPFNQLWIINYKLVMITSFHFR